MLSLILFLYFNIILLCHGQDTAGTKNEPTTDPIDLHIERPCEVYDKFCIRKFFARHSHCRPVDGPVPDPAYRDMSVVAIPHANLTLIKTADSVSGLNGRIVEFYINRVTDKLVLAVEFNNLSTVSTKAFLVYHRSAQEPSVYTVNYASINFTSLVMTITVPYINNLQLDRSEIFAYANDLPEAILSPEIFVKGATDPQTLEALSATYANLATTTREAELTESTFFIISFIQYNLCDFGIKLI